MCAGQMRKSPFSFSSIGDTSPLLWLSRRYAILDGPTMPIVAEGDEEPNNTYVEQLTASARAAVQVGPCSLPSLYAHAIHLFGESLNTDMALCEGQVYLLSACV